MIRTLKIPLIVITGCFLIAFLSCKKKSEIPVVTTSAVSDITQTTAASGGEVTSAGSADVSARGVCWGTDANPVISGSATNDGSGTGSFTSIITGLNPGTVYHTRAYATNRAGTSYGSDLQFTTASATAGSTDVVNNNTGNSNSNPVSILEGQTYSNTSSNWSGVNIQRSNAINLIFRNNSVSSSNSEGYLLQAGDEGPGKTNNKLDGASITGNKFTWNGTDKASTITHGIFTGYNINCLVEYNYLFRVPTGVVLKSNGMTYTAGGVAYNIINQTGDIAIAIKGTNGVAVYNNTFYSNEVTFTNNSAPGTAYGIVDIFANDGLSPKVYSKGTKIKNNIFYTANQIYNISIEDSQDLEGFESDYNLFWCETGAPVFNYLGSKKTFAEWQALGFDTHSIVVNPQFNNVNDFVPAARLDYGTDLGSTWSVGLSTTASWTVGTAPATNSQNGTWQVGARIY
jgi:hypothetical protein